MSRRLIHWRWLDGQLVRQQRDLLLNGQPRASNETKVVLSWNQVDNNNSHSRLRRLDISRQVSVGTGKDVEADEEKPES